MFGLQNKYINPFTDFGFKKLFGEEPNKDLLMDFLNELLHEQEGTIVELTYLKNEHLGAAAIDRRAIFDLYCENEKGERFIVEIQKSKQNFFKDRMVYYATFPIQEQAQKTIWDFQLKAVYTIGILDFVFDEDKGNKRKYRYDIKLADVDTCKVFYDKLTFIYLEMPKFTKTIDKLETRFEKWMYVLKHLDEFERIPEKLQERIFEKLFKVAEIAKFNRAELLSYEDSLKHYRDMHNTLDTARSEGFNKGYQDGRQEGIEQGIEQGIEKGIEKGIEQGIEKGIEKGIEQGKREIVLTGLKNGLSPGILSTLTGLPLSQIKKMMKS